MSQTTFGGVRVVTRPERQPWQLTLRNLLGRDWGAAGSFCASATGEDLNRPLTAVTADLPHRMPAPTRIRTMPTAIALLNGNTAADRTGFFGSRSRSPDSRERSRGGGICGGCGA